MTGAATVAGFAAYRSGNGVLALDAFDRALAADAGNDRARALSEALQAGVPPHEAADWAGINPVANEGGGES